MRKEFLLCLLLLLPFSNFARPHGDSLVVFRFVPGKDMFYVPYRGNEVQLSLLYGFLDTHKAEIADGRMPVYVNGYTSSLDSRQANLALAKIRSNRVKSEMITRKGLKESNFVTANHVGEYEGLRDVVIVTMRLPRQAPAVAAEASMPAAEARSQAAPARQAVQTEPEQKPAQSQPAPAAPPAPAPVAKRECRYDIDLRTNLLYDAFLLPTLGVEWHLTPGFGLKVDGSWSHWGSETGNVQKIWLVSPELRWYTGAAKRFYLGAGGNAGDYNVYGGMIGGFFPDKAGYGGYSGPVGYQGTLYGGGLVLGCRARLAGALFLDLNLGLGYTRLEYDTFQMIDGVRVYQSKNRIQNFWGPTQAGVSLAWKISNR